MDKIEPLKIDDKSNQTLVGLTNATVNKVPESAFADIANATTSKFPEPAFADFGNATASKFPESAFADFTNATASKVPESAFVDFNKDYQTTYKLSDETKVQNEDETTAALSELYEKFDSTKEKVKSLATNFNKFHTDLQE